MATSCWWIRAVCDSIRRSSIGFCSWIYVLVQVRKFEPHESETLVDIDSRYIITTPNQLTASALVIQYWCPPEQVNPGAFIAVFLVTIIAINYLGVRFFGEFEFWLSSAKVLVLFGLIFVMLVIVCGGAPEHGATGFKYYSNPGAFATYLGTGATGKFTGFWYSFTNAVFAYLGTELVGVTVGEAQNPRRNIPRAIRLTFYRILVFYILLVSTCLTQLSSSFKNILTL